MKNIKTPIKKSVKKPVKNPTIELTVDKECGLQEFLLENLKKESRNKVKALLKFKAVTVNGKCRTKFDFPLTKGQTVVVAIVVDRSPAKNPLLDIIYEDDDIIAINKPAGLLSIASDTESERTAYHILMEYEREKNIKNRVYVVHRLDKDTSGVLVIAKNEKMKLALQDNWANIVKTRGYVAIVEGVPVKKTAKLVSWLKETKTHLIYVSDTPRSGLEAITNYEVIKEGINYCLLDINLETGRKNQIRVQLQEIGHPIAGDKKYGATTSPIKRLCLHANKLELIHPYTKELMTFETPLPKEFKWLVNKN